MGLFGNFFDFDGDGKSSMFETFLGLEVLSELKKVYPCLMEASGKSFESEYPHSS